jgi:hypothetical protein
MDARDAAARWVEAWTRGWSRQDPEPILALYATAAFFRSHPFREAEPAADYVTRVLAEEESVEFEFGEPIVDGNRAAIEYHARSRLKSGGTEEFTGVSLVHFGDDGLVVEQRDVWTLRD